jgi:hypothetical protein
MNSSSVEIRWTATGDGVADFCVFLGTFIAMTLHSPNRIIKQSLSWLVYCISIQKWLVKLNGAECRQRSDWWLAMLIGSN